MNVPTPSSPQDFKKKRRIGHMLTLPSGLVIKVKSVDLVGLVASGSVPNSLLETIQRHLAPLGENATVESASELAAQMEPEDLAKAFSLMDNVVVAMAMDPIIHPMPATEDDRKDDLLYVDELEGEDKLEMFNWSQGGTEGMKRFPEGPEASVAPMEESGGSVSEALGLLGPAQ